MTALIATLFILAGSSAHAACVSPAGVQGEFRYLAPELRFCDGNGWQTTSVTTTATACTQAGEITYVGNVMRYCNGSVLVQMNGPAGAACTGADGGTLAYNSTAQSGHFCNGTNYVQTRLPAPAAALVQSKGSSGGLSGNTRPVAMTSAVTTGNLIVCTSAMAQGYSLTGITDNKGNTYQAILPSQTTGDGAKLEVWYAQNVTGGSSFSLTMTYPSAATGKYQGYLCTEFSGMLTSNVLDQAAYATANTDSASPGITLNTTSNNELLYQATYESNYCGAASGWTDIGAPYSEYIGYKTVGALGAYATPLAAGCGTYWHMFSVSFRSR